MAARVFKSRFSLNWLLKELHIQLPCTFLYTPVINIGIGSAEKFAFVQNN